MTIYKTLQIICFDKSEETDDKWDRRAKEFKDLYKAEMTKLNDAYDFNQDGDIDEHEEDNPPSFMNIGLTR
jgi:hypothetical protein